MSLDQYSWLRRCSNEELNKLFDEVLLKSAFQKTPKWKQWVIGLSICVTLFSGVGTTLEVMLRSSLYERVLMALGFLGAFGLWNVLKIETEHSKLQNAIRMELERRS